ncbi:dTDP-4-dehydrorhamnose 3,5-epimerase [bacterium]|nr:dTDP-4-dehydrorhamnose 3,5-epimerase [bacterium]
MQLNSTPLKDCYEVQAPVFSDTRGNFIKSFQKSAFLKHGIGFDITEIYYSASKKNVLRGMHFQLPPHDHGKLVSCLTGSAFDVVVDLRKNSATYGQAASFLLSGGEGVGVFIPSGFAHGFCAFEDNTLIAYAVSSEHDSKSDSGVHWSTVGITWPTESPIVSERDQNLIPLQDFETPF